MHSNQDRVPDTLEPDTLSQQVSVPDILVLSVCAAFKLQGIWMTKVFN